MRIKTFYTKTMSEALREIKAHLGPEAMLLSTKEIPRRAGVWGRSSGFEVVAASDHSDEGDVFSPSSEQLIDDGKEYSSEKAFAGQETEEPLPETYSPRTMAKKPKASPVAAPKANAKANAKENAKAKAKAKKSGRNKVAEKSDAVLSDSEFPIKGRIPLGLYHDLIECGVESSLARELLLSGCENLTAGQKRSRPALLRSIAQAAMPFVAAPSMQNGMPGKKIVAFIGPTGVGKTTSLAKLAARLALQKKKKVVLVTLDGYRIGAIEQLRSYAGLMGIPFRFVDQVSDLAQVIEENNRRDYILIDTAGRGPKDMKAMHALAAFLKQSNHIERHLVLSATTKQSDMRKIMDQFEICAPDHLLFTKLDETSTPGPILNELVRTRKSFSYYTNGQKVPDDLHAVPRERIIDIVLNRNENAFKE
jgi:flagellar biosynthesis protein FlhF